MDKEERDRIEDAFIARMDVLNVKVGSRKYYLAQVEFFVGVMVALKLLNYAPWSIMIIAGRDICENRRKENAK